MRIVGWLSALTLMVGGTAGASEINFNSLVTRQLVPDIQCLEANGDTARGSGVRLGPTLVITANHVGAEPQCMINGLPFVVKVSRPDIDFDSLETLDTEETGWASFSCEEIHPGQPYTAYGYADGHYPNLYRVEVYGVGRAVKSDDGFSQTAIFVGEEHFIPGMSGGAIVNRNGSVVAIIIGYNTDNLSVSYGRMLKDTPLCSK